MRRLGVVSHYARQGFLIVRCEHVPELNSKVVDKNLNFVGVVKDVFGPVASPYAAVKPRVKKPEDYIGVFLYVESRRRSFKGKMKKVKKGKNGRSNRRSSAKSSPGKRRPAPKRRG